jgi:hypothetical protein
MTQIRMQQSSFQKFPYAKYYTFNTHSVADSVNVSNLFSPFYYLWYNKPCLWNNDSQIFLWGYEFYKLSTEIHKLYR